MANAEPCLGVRVGERLVCREHAIACNKHVISILYPTHMWLIYIYMHYIIQLYIDGYIYEYMNISYYCYWVISCYKLYNIIYVQH